MGMKRSRKTATLIVITLAAVACLVWLMSRSNEPVGAGVPNTAGGASFEVQVEKPRMDRFLGGILPTKIESKLLGGGELRFDHASRGAQVGRVGRDRLELRADGWELLLQTDGQGRITPATRLLFPIEIAEKRYTLRCRPADAATGYLHTTARANSDLIDGRFLVELAACVNAESGKILDTEAGGNPGQAWPSSPLTVRGNFNGLPTHPSPEAK
ncbi:MAG: hypothetical protein QOG00_2113 [Pyrinomonadaceae bacterium]|nr:hypothetical protein [Pyrinomonadaceae bacterium]